MAHAGGRPTEYSEEVLAKAEEYLASCEDEEVERGTDERPEYVIRVKLPTKGGLARFLGVSRDSLYEWAKVYPEFSDIMEALGAEQEDKLINNGLSGDYNPTIAKVLLTKHGYRDAVDTDITSKGEKLEASDPKAIALAKEYEDKLKTGI
jgi:hypothetical protein